MDARADLSWDEAYHAVLPLMRADNRTNVGYILREYLLLAAVPPLVLLVLGRTTPFGKENVRAAVLVTGMVTLIALTAVAAKHAGYTGWRLLVASLSGGVIGLVVIVLQVVLKPK